MAFFSLNFTAPFFQFHLDLPVGAAYDFGFGFPLTFSFVSI